MKEKLISLAKEKGFVSNIIGKSVESVYSKKDFYYLWMCELKKWLIKNYNINVFCYRPNETGYWAYNLENKAKYNSIKEALELGLFETLNLININEK